MATRSLLAVALWALAPWAWGQSVALTGIMGQRALLVIDGAAPQVLLPGDSRQDVTLISVEGDRAVVEIHGRRQNLRVGDVPVRLSGAGGSNTGTRVVLTAGPGGHFISTGQVNGASVQFLVDTGATEVSMSTQQADRIGLQYRSGTPVAMATANGTVQGYQVHLDSVQLGAVEVYNVQAIVTPSQMPFVLLGNSFLTHFQLKQENDLLTLDKRF
ncbi:MAG TPA: retropepsin-like aspartic protease [Burkholderiaceae bacterium]|nr:retropepsin-like aspartic protease [Burkholderiaceae bacterium]